MGLRLLLIMLIGILGLSFGLAQEPAPPDAHGPVQRPQDQLKGEYREDFCSPNFQRDLRHFKHEEVDTLLATIEQLQSAKRDSTKVNLEQLAPIVIDVSKPARPIAPNTKLKILRPEDIMTPASYKANDLIDLYLLSSQLNKPAMESGEFLKEIEQRRKAKTLNLPFSVPPKTWDSLNSPQYVQLAYSTLTALRGLPLKEASLSDWAAWWKDPKNKDRLQKGGLSYFELTILKEFILNRFDRDSELAVSGEASGKPKQPYFFRAPLDMTDPEKAAQLARERRLACATKPAVAHEMLLRAQLAVSNYQTRDLKRNAHGLPPSLRRRWTDYAIDDLARSDLLEYLKLVADNDEENKVSLFDRETLNRILYTVVHREDFFVQVRELLKSVEDVRGKADQKKEISLLKQKQEQRRARIKEIDLLSQLAGKPLNDKQKQALEEMTDVRLAFIWETVRALAGKGNEPPMTTAQLARYYLETAQQKLSKDPKKQFPLLQGIIFPEKTEGPLGLDYSMIGEFKLPASGPFDGILTNLWLERQREQMINHYTRDWGANKKYSRPYKEPQLFDAFYEARYGQKISSLPESQRGAALDRLFNLLPLVNRKSPESIGTASPADNAEQDFHATRELIEGDAKELSSCTTTRDCDMAELNRWVEGRYRSMWRALEGDKTRLNEEFERLAAKPEAHKTRLADIRRHLSALDQTQTLLELELAAKNRPRSTKEAIGENKPLETVDITFNCPQYKKNVGRGVVFNGGVTLKDVPVDRLQSSEIFRRWLYQYLIDYTNRRDRELYGKIPGPDQREQIARQMSSQLRLNEYYYWRQATAFPPENVTNGEALESAFCNYRNDQSLREGGTNQFIFYALGAILRQSAEVNDRDPNLVAQRKTDWQGSYSEFKKTADFLFSLDDTLSWGAKNRKQLTITPSGGSSRLTKLAEEFQRKAQEFDIGHVRSPELENYINAQLAPLRSDSASPQDRKTLQELQAFFRTLPDSNLVKHYVLKSSAPPHIAMHLGTGDKELDRYYNLVPPAFLARQHRLAEEGLIPAQLSRDAVKRLLKHEVQRQYEAASVSFPKEQSPTETAEDQEIGNVDKVYLTRACESVMKPLMTTHIRSEVDHILSHADVRIGDYEALLKTKATPEQLIVELEDAKAVLISQILELRKFSKTKNLVIEPHLRDCLPDTSDWKAANSSKIEKGLRAIIADIDRRLLGAQGSGSANDPYFYSQPKDEALTRYLAFLEAELDGKNLYKWARDTRHTEDWSLPMAGAGPDPRGSRYNYVQLSAHLYGIGRAADWYLFSERKAKRMKHDATDIQASTDLGEFHGMTSENLAALHSLPPFLQEILTTYASASDGGRKRGPDGTIISRPGGSGRVTKIFTDLGEFDLQDPKFNERLTKLLHRPLPAQILNFVMTDPNARRGYLHMLDFRLDTALWEGQTKLSPERLETLRSLVGREKINDQRAYPLSEGNPFKTLKTPGIQGFLQEFATMTDSQKQGFREWVGKALLNELGLSPQQNFGSPDKLLEAAKRAMEERLSKANGATIQKDEVVTSVLTFMMSVLDESGDDEEGLKAAMQENSKGGLARFDPTYLAKTFAEEQRRLRQLKKNPPAHNPTGHLDDYVAQLGKSGKGLTSRRRLEILSMAPETLTKLSRLKSMMHTMLPARGFSKTKDLYDEMLQRGDAEGIDKIREFYNPEMSFYEDLSDLDLAKLREKIKARQSAHGNLTNEEREALRTLARERVNREWLPEYLRLRTPQASQDFSRFAVEMRFEQEAEQQKAEQAILEELTQEILAQTIADARKRLLGQHQGKPFAADQAERDLATLLGNATLADHEISQNPVAAELLKDPKNRELLKLLRRQAGDVLTQRFLRSLARDRDGQIPLPELDPDSTMDARTKRHIKDYVEKFAREAEKQIKKNRDGEGGNKDSNVDYNVRTAVNDFVARETALADERLKAGIITAAQHKHATEVEIPQAAEVLFERRNAAAQHLSGMLKGARYQTIGANRFKNEKDNCETFGSRVWEDWYAKKPVLKSKKLNDLKAAYQALVDTEEALIEPFSEMAAKQRQKLREFLSLRETLTGKRLAILAQMKSKEWRNKEETSKKDKATYREILARTEKELEVAIGEVDGAFKGLQSLLTKFDNERTKLLEQKKKLDEQWQQAYYEAKEESFAIPQTSDFRAFIQAKARESIPSDLAAMASGNGLDASRTSFLERYFQLRLRAETLGRGLASTSGLTTDPRFQALMAEGENGIAGCQISATAIRNLVEIPAEKEGQKIARRKKALEKLAQWNIKWDGHSLDTSKMNLKGKVPLTADALRAAMDELSSAMNEETGQVSVADAPKKDFWKDFKTAVVTRWRITGQPSYFEWQSKFIGTDTEADGEIACRVVKSSKPGEGYTFEFTNLLPLRLAARDRLDRIEVTREEIMKSLKAHSMNNQKIVSNLGFYDPTGEDMVSINLAEYQANIEALHSLGDIQAVRKNGKSGAESRALAALFDAERKTHVLTDIDQAYERIETDLAWGRASVGIAAASIPLLFLPGGAGVYGAMLAGLRTFGMVYLMSFTSTLLGTDHLPYYFGMKNENLTWGEAGPSGLISSAQFGLAATGATLAFGSLAATPWAAQLGSKSGWLGSLSRYAMSHSGLNLIGTSGLQFVAGLGMTYIDDYLNEYDTPHGKAALDQLFHTLQTAIFLAGGDQLAASYASWRLAQFLASVGINQGMTLAVNGRSEYLASVALQERLEKLEEERRKLKEDDDPTDLDRKIARVRKELALRDTLFKIVMNAAKHNVAELPAHTVFGAMAVAHAPTLRAQRSIRDLIAGKTTMEVIRTRMTKELGAEAAEYKLTETLATLPYHDLNRLVTSAQDSPHLTDKRAPESEAFRMLSHLAKNFGMKPSRAMSVLADRFAETGPERAYPLETFIGELKKLTKNAREQILSELEKAEGSGSRSERGRLALELLALDLVHFRDSNTFDVLSVKQKNGLLNEALKSDNEGTRKLFLAGAARALNTDPNSLNRFLTIYTQRNSAGNGMSWERLQKDFDRANDSANPFGRVDLINDRRMTAEDIGQLYGTEAYIHLVGNYIYSRTRQDSTALTAQFLAEKKAAVAAGGDLTLEDFVRAQRFPSLN